MLSYKLLFLVNDAMDDEKFLKMFRVLAPDLQSATDDVVLAMRNIVAPTISKSKFGDLYEQALAYLIAHKLTVQNIISEQGAAATELTAGGIISEKEGDLSRSYGSKQSNVAGGSCYMDSLQKTAYGQEFLNIRNMRIVSAATRFG